MNEFNLEATVTQQIAIKTNIDKIDSVLEEIKAKYSNVVVTEDLVADSKKDRATLNKIVDSLKSARKQVEEKGKEGIKEFLEKVKSAEKEITQISKDIDTQIKEFEEKEKEEKREYIEAKIDVESSKCKFKNAKKFIEDNPRWLNKTFSFENINKEITEQVNKLNEKYSFLIAQLEACNEEIENKISFEDIEGKFGCSYDEILKYILNKKNEIKATEENMKKKAEEDKKKAIDEANAKAEKEKEEAVEKAKDEERKRVELEHKNNASMQTSNASMQSEADGIIIKDKVHEIIESDYITLQIKILKFHTGTAKELKKFLDENEIEYKKI